MLRPRRWSSCIAIASRKRSASVGLSRPPTHRFIDRRATAPLEPHPELVSPRPNAAGEARNAIGVALAIADAVSRSTLAWSRPVLAESRYVNIPRLATLSQ